MTSPRFAAVKSTSARGFLLIFLALRQKAKGIRLGSLEILTGSREEEATAAADRATIATTIVPTASPVANPRIAPLYLLWWELSFCIK